MKTVVTTMRNEAPFILEWVAYHRLIGFDNILVYSNDCDDGTDAMLDRLQELGYLAHLRNPRRGKKPVQWTALKRAENHPYVKHSEWLYVADCDEFLNIHTGTGRLDDLIGACPSADGFLLSWRMFGSGGAVEFEDVPVTRQFTRCAPEALVWPWRAVQFKAFYRNDPDRLRLGVHKPQSRSSATDETGLRWHDDNGDRLSRVMGTVVPKTGPRYGLAQINHYPLGSLESFIVKADRGKPNHLDQGIGLDYWMDRDLNEVPDSSIGRHDAALGTLIEMFMRDEILAGLHLAGVAWRRRRFEELILRSEPFYLYSRVLRHLRGSQFDMDTQVRLLNALFRMRRNETLLRGGA
ncbi:glycosyltransferase family 2 protein [Paracoccus sp. 1_MG-2023]|uniref:glycosyltransferase family 2 protein n=1 Tax=unclassified Paracoccus (in: a-proteobacteria) TaxID=2688777 RepID=UPI001C0A64A7|nr:MULTISPECIES: glycosyltransferase family 2 protein [unclassified Paracoccus (in: a-proteobacteria)]MBU2956134.1 glycosyltransferase family 2 protein [Paracoccus sp. C2R09]MDO6667810.1 glycosyltransferase family 2 protein [Paracoccus sp. 1_MG-2023]